MRKQLLFMPPDDADIKEVSDWMQLNIQNAAVGYPLVVPPGWTYTVEKLSDPVLIMQGDFNNRK